MKKIEGKLESAKSDRIKQRLKAEYTEKDREEKRSAREDKRNWMEEQAEAAENGRSKELYTITKMLTGERRRQTVGVKDKHGTLRTDKNDRMDRWREHFSEILNRDESNKPN